MYCDTEGKWKSKGIAQTMDDVETPENCKSDTTTSLPEPESQKERDRLLYNRAYINRLDQKIKTAKENAERAVGGLEEDSNCEKFKELVKEGKSYS